MALILIVEDAWLTRRTVCKVLQKEGHTTLEASNGQEGLEILRTHNPDCILLDLLMPEIDGWGVLQFLRQQNSNIPVIVLTADIQQSTRQKCFELGAIALINKPPKPDELRAALAQAFSVNEETSR